MKQQLCFCGMRHTTPTEASSMSLQTYLTMEVRCGNRKVENVTLSNPEADEIVETPNKRYFNAGKWPIRSKTSMVAHIPGKKTFVSWC